jgi:hypothetical protein
MILDNETQRQSLIELMKQASFSGVSLEEAYHLLQALKGAKIADGTVSST